MRAFALRSLLFGAISLVLAAVLHSLLLHGLRERRTHTLGQWNRLREGSMNADVLFTGSSRCLMHYDARAIGSLLGMRCWNLGMDGSQLTLQAPWLATYLRYNRPPRLVVQEVDIISLAPDSDVYFPSQYPPYLDEPDVYRTLRQLDPDWWKDRWIPLYSFHRFGYAYAGIALKGLLHAEDTANDILKNGFELRDWKWDGGFDRAKAKNPDGRTYPVRQEAIETLRSIVRTAKAAGSEVVLVYAPELKENQDLTLNRDEILGWYRRIAEEERIPFWDLSTLPFCGDRAYFYNSQHMNAAGVDLLTPVIADSLGSWFGRAGAAQPKARS